MSVYRNIVVIFILLGMSACKTLDGLFGPGGMHGGVTGG